MIVMLLVAAAATMLATHYGLRSRLVSQEARRIHLTALTDAVVAESVARLHESSGFGGVARKDFGGGTLASEIESVPPDRRIVVATASYRGWTRTVRVGVRLHMGSIEIESWQVQPPG